MNGCSKDHVGDICQSSLHKASYCLSWMMFFPSCIMVLLVHQVSNHSWEAFFCCSFDARFPNVGGQHGNPDWLTNKQQTATHFSFCHCFIRTSIKRSSASESFAPLGLGQYIPGSHQQTLEMHRICHLPPLFGSCPLTLNLYAFLFFMLLIIGGT